MRGFVMVLVAMMLSAVVAHGAEERAAIAAYILDSGTQVELLKVEMAAENLGDRFVVRGLFREPRPPEAAVRTEERREAAEVCRDHYRQVLSHAEGYTGRPVTHFEVLYQHGTEAYHITTNDYRGFRFRVRYDQCKPPHDL